MPASRQRIVDHVAVSYPGIASGWHQKSRQNTHSGCLPGGIGSKKSHYLTLFYIKADVVYSQALSVVFG